MHEIIRNILLKNFISQFPYADVRIIGDDSNIKWNVVNIQILTSGQTIIDCIFYEKKQIASVIYLNPDKILYHIVLDYVDPMDTIDAIVAKYQELVKL